MPPVLAGLGGLLCTAIVAAISSIAADAAAPSERARIAAVTRPTTNFDKPEPYERRPAGAATVFKALNADIFSHVSANMSFERELQFKVGNGIFRKIWVSAPSSTKSSDGLGPLFNARSCQHCHLKDGRGHVPAKGERAVSMFLRLSVPPRSAAERTALKTGKMSVIPDPTYGGQLQNFAIRGMAAEGRMEIRYRPLPVKLADGTVVTLRKPSYRVADLRYGPMGAGAMISPRVAPPMIGVGLLEAIAARDILAGADPDDGDGDGISGRANRVWSSEHGKLMLGRFGWKAGQPTVAQQAAGAFLGDIGLSTPIYGDHGGDCMSAQKQCKQAPNGAGGPAGGTTEVPRSMFDLVVFYSRNLGVPARRRLHDPQVMKGKALFYRSGCIGCHRPKFVTRRIPDRPEQSFQLIWPYTDLLLHDMGKGLADNRPEGRASGREWRTAPLWGVGLAKTVNPRASFLHDGRARTLLEAILWHGGEAEAAKQRVVGMSRAEREALLAFLRSL
jgi:CxxC motif-containing protein (DUF1111 family)